MKVLMLNGSSNIKGCTYTALKEIADVLEQNGIESEIINLGAGPIRDCIGCGHCRKSGSGKCVFNDDIANEIIEKAAAADGFIFGTPVYYSHPSGRIFSVLDRAFFAAAPSFQHKPAAAIASARRAGTTASLSALTKYFTINQMPVVSSTYWNMVHGAQADDVLKDEEGLQTMRNLGRNMAWLLKCIEAGKKANINAPKAELKYNTNFIR